MGIVLQFVVRCETLLKRNPAKGEPMTGDKGVRAEDGWQVPTVVTINLGAGLGRWDAGTLGRWDAGTLGRWDAGTLGRWDAGALGRWTAGPPDRWTSLQCSKKWAYLSKTGFPIPVHLRI
jgi:hypothetical protein